MVKPDLTTQMLDAGRQLLELLDRQKFRAPACFWFYFPESDRWRFVIASPEVPPQVYRSGDFRIGAGVVYRGSQAMTTDEYRDLIAYLRTKFGEVDTRFRAVDSRFERLEREMQEFRGEVDRRFTDVDQRMATGFAEVKDLLRVSHAGLDRRVGRLERRVGRCHASSRGRGRGPGRAAERGSLVNTVPPPRTGTP